MDGREAADETISEDRKPLWIGFGSHASDAERGTADFIISFLLSRFGGGAQDCRLPRWERGI